MRAPHPTLILIALLALTIPATSTLAAEDGKEGPVYVNPEKAQQQSAAYRIQGEYVGRLDEGEGSGEKVGVQVVALGDGKFQATSYRGGLPGDGWSGDMDDREVIVGEMNNGQVVFKGKRYASTIEDGKMIARLEDGTKIGTLEKVNRKSPTLGKKPPEGAIYLFDGTHESMKHWRDGARMLDDAAAIVEAATEGLLLPGATTKQEFRDFTLHVEFRIPFAPAAGQQHRGNSGAYILNRYEVQMLDTFGLEPKNNHCGALYEFKASRINMAYPPLAWQTYDIDFTAPRFNDAGEKTQNARITVRHNGVLIHDDVELPHGTGSRKDRAEQPRGPILLQEHNNPVRYRNIWIIDKK